VILTTEIQRNHGERGEKGFLSQMLADENDCADAYLVICLDKILLSASSAQSANICDQKII